MKQQEVYIIVSESQDRLFVTLSLTLSVIAANVVILLDTDRASSC